MLNLNRRLLVQRMLLRPDQLAASDQTAQMEAVEADSCEKRTALPGAMTASRQ